MKSIEKCNNPLKDNCGNLCMKKIISLASFISALGLAIYHYDLEIVGLFLSIGFGNTILTGIREIKSDKLSNS